MRIYFSGPHGSGKSTLMRTLKGHFPSRTILYPEDRFDFPKVEGDYFERLKSKLLRYYFEEQDQKKYEAELEPGKILFCNRCVYDAAAYRSAYLQLGWINGSQEQSLAEIKEKIFPQKISSKEPEKIVIVNPSLETLTQQLQKRWNEGVVKWNEDNFEYLKATQKAFQKIAQEISCSEGDVLYLPEEQLEEKVKKVVEWIGQKKIK